MPGGGGISNGGEPNSSSLTDSALPSDTAISGDRRGKLSRLREATIVWAWGRCRGELGSESLCIPVCRLGRGELFSAALLGML